MIIPGLSEGLVRQHATAEAFDRGQDADRRGAVLSLVRSGGVLRAEVEGSQLDLCRVRITFDRGGITGTTCSCSGGQFDWCEHVVAALLNCLDDPGGVEERPALEEMLARLDREQLRDLLLDLAARDPGVAEQMEDRAALLFSATSETGSTEPAAHPARPAALDPQPIRREVAAILHSLDRMRRSEAYWQVGSVVNEVDGVLDQARALLQAGDGENALICLEAVTDEYIAGWTGLDDSDGYASDFFRILGSVWTEAALVADLSPTERRQWADRLTEWQAEMSDYGVDEAFDTAQAAFLLGWDDPSLQRQLRGEGLDGEDRAGEALWYSDDLTAARLQILDRQRRYQEYLRLAQAEGEMQRYVLMLARLGQVQEAVNVGLQSLDEPEQSLSLAVALREAGDLVGALRVAEHGLTLPGSKGRVATWLCDLAQRMGRSELALHAAVVAFRSAPSLEIYLRVQELARERWPELREELLAHLCRHMGSHAQGQVDVFLHEGLLDDAIAAAEQDGWYELIEQVMDAVVNDRPEWAIQAARKQAERIMDSGRAQHYHHAAGWLKRARTAYRVLGREAEWQAYLGEIRARHSRKYKLMGMLKAF